MLWQAMTQTNCDNTQRPTHFLQHEKIICTTKTWKCLQSLATKPCDRKSLATKPMSGNRTCDNLCNHNWPQAEIWLPTKSCDISAGEHSNSEVRQNLATKPCDRKSLATKWMSGHGNQHVTMFATTTHGGPHDTCVSVNHMCAIWCGWLGGQCKWSNSDVAQK